MGGIGEKMDKIEAKEEDIYILVVNPGKFLSTKEVFGLYNKKYQKNLDNKGNQHSNNIIDLIKNRRNDLEKPAIEIIPEIGKIINLISQQNNCLIARMSGSGATCFGLFDNEKDLGLAYNKLNKDFPGFYIEKSKLLYKI